MKSRPDSVAFGLKPEIFQQLSTIFQAYENIDSVVLYGSRAKGTYHDGSDIDLTIKGDLITDSLVGKVYYRYQEGLSHFPQKPPF